MPCRLIRERRGFEVSTLGNSAPLWLYICKQTNTQAGLGRLSIAAMTMVRLLSQYRGMAQREHGWRTFSRQVLTGKRLLLALCRLQTRI